MQNRRSGFTLEQEAEHLCEGAGVGEWTRTGGGSGAPEPCLRRVLRAGGFAQLCREIVHREAVGAELA